MKQICIFLGTTDAESKSLDANVTIAEFRRLEK